MKTRDKIVYASLALFNKSGEPNITTNHIPSHLGISPDNLYYHFHNKQEIIREIFESYSSELLERFTPVDGEQESRTLLKDYLDSMFTLMWKYRFFYANMAQLLQRDKILHEKYLAVQEKSQINLQAIFKIFLDLKLIDIKEQEIKSLLTSLHLIIFSWLSYQSSMSLNSDITEQVVHKGMLQVTAILKLFTTDLGKEQIHLLEEEIKTANGIYKC